MTHTVSRTISDATLSRIIQIESAGNPRAKARTSSATGLGQFLNGTWLAELQEHRPDLFNGPPFDDELALRTDPTIAIELLARFTEDNARFLGPGYTDADLYLAHFSGVGVAKRMLRAPGAHMASQYFRGPAIAANKSILQGKTVGEVREWAARKMAGAGKVNWVARLYRPHAVARSRPKLPVDDPIEPGAEPSATVVASDDQSGKIERVQKRLTALGYHEIGGIDGIFAGRTVAGIAAFKNDRRLAGLPVIDDVLTADIAAAEAEGWNRPIAKERAEATPEKVAEKISTVDASKSSKLWAWVLGIPSAITAFVKGVADNFETALQSPTLNAVKEFFADNLLYVALGVVGIAGMIWWKSKQAEDGTVKAFQEGRLS